MSRNLVEPETAEGNRSGIPGRYTFNAPLPHGYEGVAFTVAAVRVGDHAHVDVESGRAMLRSPHEPRDGHTYNRGRAGRLILRWHEWEIFRDALVEHEFIYVAEVENPTFGQVLRHTGNLRDAIVADPPPPPDPPKPEAPPEDPSNRGAPSRWWRFGW